MSKTAQIKEVRISGVAASPGIALGPVFFMGTDVVTVESRQLHDDQIENEVTKLCTAIDKSKAELEELVKRTSLTIGEESAQIFQVHQLMLEDVMIVDEAIKKIRDEKVNADQAFLEILEHYEMKLEAIEGEYLKARSADIRDIKRRVIRNIQGEKKKNLQNLNKPAIIFAKELTPSDTVNLDRDKVLGFAMDFGGRTSHTAIMARSIKVPSVVGLQKIGQMLHTGDYVILDGYTGLLIVHPNPETIEEYKSRFSDYQNFQKRLDHLKNYPARTLDGKDIELAANIEFIDEASEVTNLGAEGVGLFRTEYLFLTTPELPSEDEQFDEYVRIVKALNNKPIVIRTFDLGGDKMPKSLNLPPEDNPFLGARGIRLYREKGGEHLFKTQLRAIVRASAYGNVRIMFPMISCISEIRFCQSVLQEVKLELKKEGRPFANDIPIGAMIEVPSAAVIADIIARECDFLSIGTNDLIQYTLAVDRGNQHIAYLYQQYNPSVLRLIKDIIDRGHQNGVWVGVCGEMASDPLLTMILIGMGLDEFSVSPVSLLLIKEIIRRVEVGECITIVDQVINLSSAEEIENELKHVMKTKFPDLYLLF